MIWSEDANPAFGLVYDGIGAGGDNKLHLREFIGGDTTSVVTYMADGKVGIGTSIPISKLEVKGGDIRVTGGSFWDDGMILSVPDYVFQEKYNLRSLKEVEQFINTNHHLEGFPSMYDIKGWSALSLQDREMKLLEKVEELTLYILEHERTIENLKSQLKSQKKTTFKRDQDYNQLIARINSLEARME